MVIGILSFSITAFALSWAVGKRGGLVDRSELALLVLVTVWGAMFYGMCVSHL